MLRDDPLTAAFKRANGIERAYRIDGTLHVDARSALGPQAMRALQYAAGDKIVVTVLPATGNQQEVTTPQNRAVATQVRKFQAGPAENRQNSLVERLLQPLFVTRDAGDALRQMARLLAAGRSARLLGLERGRLEPAFKRLAEDEVAEQQTGFSLAEWVASVPEMPVWVHASLSACLDEDGQARAVRAIAALMERQADWKREVTASAVRSLFAWPAMTLIWLLMSWALGIAIGAIGLAFALRFKQLKGNAATDDTVRAEVLRIVAIELRSGLAAGQAIRIAAMRMKDIEPTWGEPPETREGLARMLRLDDVDHIGLMSGELGPACLRLARDCERRNRTSLERASIWTNVALALLLGSTVMGLLA